MEEGIGGGGGGEADGGGFVIRRRITLLDQMSAVHDRRDSLAGLTLDAILSNKRPLPPPSSPPSAPAGRTLLDIIRDEDPNDKTFVHKDRKSWKLFRDKLRLKRAGSAWTSSVNVPASDVPIRSGGYNISNPRSLLSRRSSVRFQTNPPGDLTPQLEDSVSTTNRGLTPQFTRRCSSRISSSTAIPAESNHHEDSPDVDGSPSRSSRPMFSRYNSSRVTGSNPEPDEDSVDPFEVAREGTRRLAVALAQERALSAREAVVAQEAAEAEAAAVAAEAAEAEASVEEEATAEEEAERPEQPPAPRMSLMDLLEETDRQMGVEGSRYTVGEEEEEDEVEEEEYEEEGEEAEENGGGGGIEYNCCVCMVRHKGAAFIPCGHTFCRLCSRELWVQRGNCPLCNGFILEILDIF